MRILIDENLPIAFLTELLIEHEVSSVKDLGLAGIKNGELLKVIEGQFDVFLTADKNLRYQQNLKGRSFAILELFTNRRPLLMEYQTQILKIIGTIDGCDYLQLNRD